MLSELLFHFSLWNSWQLWMPDVCFQRTYCWNHPSSTLTYFSHNVMNLKQKWTDRSRSQLPASGSGWLSLWDGTPGWLLGSAGAGSLSEAGRTPWSPQRWPGAPAGLSHRAGSSSREGTARPSVGNEFLGALWTALRTSCSRYLQGSASSFTATVCSGTESFQLAK